LLVFTVILIVSALVSSSGAFILTWNASVLGVFMGILARNLEGMQVLTGNGSVPTPLAYIPHATLEMAGFIVAGITGSLISAAIYREHFTRETWIDYMKMVGIGVGLVVIAAFMETA
ncbi:MAG: putative membrane protein SpoIIM required for sporulation, partial [Candidatus Nanohaloarchaea archaeon]